MKKVLFYINAIHEGGAERVMVNLSAGLADAGYDVILVTSFFDKWEYPVSPKVKRLSLENEEKNSNVFARNISRILKLRKVLKKEKPDVAISFMAEPNFRMLIATIGLPVKRIISVRNDPNVEYSGKIGWCVGKILLPFADGCVFQTKDAQEWFPLKLQKKSKIIYNAVAEEFYRTTRGAKSGTIVACGRLVKQKNYPLLINAFAEANKRNPESVLLIYGDGPDREKLSMMVNNLGLSNKISFMGTTNDMPKVLSEASMFVLSSDYEGMPNVLMEALAVGVPSIATDCPCGGPRTLIQNGVNGILVPINETIQLANMMDKLLAEQEYANELGRNAKEMAMSFHSAKVMCDWVQYIECCITP